jgi:hypothetical protein
MNYILQHYLEGSTKIIGIRIKLWIITYMGFLIVNYFGIILFIVLWTATEHLMDLSLIE